jgi:iron complex outermembrane recepter protein
MSCKAQRFRLQLLSSGSFLPVALLGGGIIAAASFDIPRASAQDGQIEDVVVTVRHGEEKNQDVPLPVTGISGAKAQTQHVDRLQDFVQFVPNFNPSITNPRTSALNIRGIGGLAGGSDGSESGVGLIVDDVFYTYVGFAWLDLVDLQSLEVVRGPQGTLLGKNTTIGAVKVTTELPSFTPSTSVETSFSNHNRITEKINTTGAIIPGELAYRFTFYGDKGDGLYPNVNGTGNNSYLDNNRWGIRGQLLGINGDTTDRLIFEHLASNEVNNYTANWYTEPFTHYASGASRFTFSQIEPAIFGVSPGHNPYQENSIDNFPIRTQTDGVSNNFSWNLEGGYTLTDILAWRRFEFRPHNGTNNGINVSYINGFDVNVDQFSHEIRLASPQNQPVEWQIGSYGLAEKVISNDRVLYQGAAAQLYNCVGQSSLAAMASCSANTNSAVLNGIEVDQNSQAKNGSIAGFGQLTWHVTEKGSLTAGVRDTYEDRIGTVSQYWFGGAQNLSTADQNLRLKLLDSQNFGPGGQTAAAYTNNGLGPIYSLSGEQYTNSVSWLVNPSYKFNDNLLGYFSVAQGAKSGAVNTRAAPLYDPAGNFLGYQPVITKEETSFDYELGFKSSWFDNRLVVNANLYWNDIKNYQAQLTNNIFDTATNTNVVKTYLGNVPEVLLRGIEFDGRWNPIDRLFINFSGAITDARYVKFDAAAVPADWAFGAGAPSSLSLSGTRIISVPPWTLNVGFNYEHPLPWGTFSALNNQSLVGFVYANEAIKGKTQFLLPTSTYQFDQNTYGILNLGLGVHTEDGKYTAYLWAKNAFNKQYFTSFALGSSTAPATVGLGDPLYFGGTVKMVF